MKKTFRISFLSTLVIFTCCSMLIKTDNSNTGSIMEIKKMNVVYRGVTNPIQISFPKAKEIIVAAPGLKKVDNNGGFSMIPQSGSEVNILVKGVMANGDTITDTKTLRIKTMGHARGTINGLGCGNKCELRLTKQELMNGKIGMKIGDFLYDMDFLVTAFKVKLPRNRIIRITGNKMNDMAKKELNKLTRNDRIQIFDIVVSCSSVNFKLKPPSPILIKVIR